MPSMSLDPSLHSRWKWGRDNGWVKIRPFLPLDIPQITSGLTQSYHVIEICAPTQGYYFLCGMGTDKYTQMLAVSTKHSYWCILAEYQLCLCLYSFYTHLSIDKPSLMPPQTLGPLCLPLLAFFHYQNYTEVVLDLRLN